MRKKRIRRAEKRGLVAQEEHKKKEEKEGKRRRGHKKKERDMIFGRSEDYAGPTERRREKIIK